MAVVDEQVSDEATAPTSPDEEAGELSVMPAAASKPSSSHLPSMAANDEQVPVTIEAEEATATTSPDEEADELSVIPAATASKVVPIAAVARLAFQSVGVVYGDIGTSPLYVFAATFPDRVPSKADVLGALSLVVYSLTLFPLVKYVLFVLRANDGGEGGTFAMYSLICRHAKVSMMADGARPQAQAGGRRPERSTRMKKALEKSACAKTALLSLTLLATCMVIGDGILTPCISVLSAVDGIRRADEALSKDAVVVISVAILAVLFCVQRFGTGKMGYTFAPVILVWCLLIAVVGIYNTVRHDSSVLKALNPNYIISYVKRNPKEAWISLGGVVLCMTGTEAMFAGLSHFSVRAIQVAFTGLVYPCLICAYVGQAAYLADFPSHAADAFYKSTPGSVYWPMFIVAVMASVIASQAMISATFAIVKQSMDLGCFPRVRVVHTSSEHEGQIYIPEINFLLLLACVVVTAVFKDAANLGSAYGIAVVAVMLVTSSLFVLIMLMVWQTSLAAVAAFVVVFLSFELLYFSSLLEKFSKGGYLPLAFAGVLFTVMYVWQYVQSRRREVELEQKVSTEYLSNLRVAARVPGVGLLYTELAQGIPPIFPHFLANLPALHAVLVLVSVKQLTVSVVPPASRFLLRRVGPRNQRMYRCIVRYGYRDQRAGSEEFERLLAERLKAFVRANAAVEGGGGLAREEEEAEEEVRFLEWSWAAGVVYMLGHGEVRASKNSGLVKRVVVNYLYDFLRRNFRQGFVDLQIPNENLLLVGMNHTI